MRPSGTKLIASNRKARRDYTILDVIEAGLVLSGSEVKSLRTGHVQLTDAYARLRSGEIWMEGVHIAPYQFAVGVGAHDPDRPRKLLLNRGEIDRLEVAGRPGARRARPARAVLQGGPRQGRARHRQGPHEGRQATSDGRARFQPRDRTRPRSHPQGNGLTAGHVQTRRPVCFRWSESRSEADRTTGVVVSGRRRARVGPWSSSSGP